MADTIEADENKLLLASEESQSSSASRKTWKTVLGVATGLLLMGVVAVSLVAGSKFSNIQN